MWEIAAREPRPITCVILMLGEGKMLWVNICGDAVRVEVTRLSYLIHLRLIGYSYKRGRLRLPALSRFAIFPDLALVEPLRTT